MSFRFLNVYPPDSHESTTVLISQSTDTQELQQLLRTEFNVPDSANIALDYHDRVSDRFCIVPVSAIRDLVLGSTSEISVRLHIYPKAEEHRHVNQVSNGDDARTENDGDTDEGFSISSVTSAVLATADSNRGAWENERYFGEYSKIMIHWNMLKDERRCETYKQAIKECIDDIKGKVVLDCGCGTGILSILAAKAGAKKVYAIEASDMHEYATSMVQHNNVGHIVEVIHGKIEEVTLPVDFVDVIISEWMGVFLFFESMLDSVFYARDKWLKPDGLLFPSHAKMYLAPCRMDEYYNSRVSFFEKKHYGIDYLPMQFMAKVQFTEHPLKGYTDTKPEHIAGKETLFMELDIKNGTLDAIRAFSSEFKLQVEPGNPHIHGIVTWWQVEFTGSSKAQQPIILSTSPFLPSTHWYWDCFLFDEPLPIPEDDRGVEGQIVATQHNYWRRHYAITLSCRTNSSATYKEFLM